jgi:hypothetical protein
MIKANIQKLQVSVVHLNLAILIIHVLTRCSDKSWLRLMQHKEGIWANALHRNDQVSKSIEVFEN